MSLMGGGEGRRDGGRGLKELSSLPSVFSRPRSGAVVPGQAVSDGNGMLRGGIRWRSLAGKERVAFPRLQESAGACRNIGSIRLLSTFMI